MRADQKAYLVSRCARLLYGCCEFGECKRRATEIDSGSTTPTCIPFELHELAEGRSPQMTPNGKYKITITKNEKPAIPPEQGV